VTRKRTSKVGASKKPAKTKTVVAGEKDTVVAVEKPAKPQPAATTVSHIIKIWKGRRVLVIAAGLCMVALIVVGVVVPQRSITREPSAAASPDGVTNANNTAPSPVTEAIRISDVEVTEITANSLTVVWKTNLPSTGELVAMDQKSSTSVASWPSNALITDHKVTIESLQSSTAYSLSIKSTDASGNVATFESNYPYQTSALRLSTSMAPGQVSPEFSLKTLDGATINLSDYKGKWVMLVFWMTSCAGCREELPYLDSFWKNSQVENFVVLTVNVAGNEAVTRSFVKGQNISIPVLIDKDKAAYEKYSVAAFPTAFIIDQDGIIATVKEQAFKDEADIDAFVRASLKAR